MQVERPWIHLIGTDTDVGKTWVCRLLTTPGFLTPEGAVATKPIHSGWPEGDTWGNDLAVHGENVKQHPPEVLNHSRFKLPMSPQGAARIEDKTIERSSLNEWKASSQSILSPNTVVCEGIGGVCCPLGPEWTYLDWLAELKEPAILVCRVGLGTLNHTIMSARLLEANSVPLLAVIVNEEKPFKDDDPIRANCLWELEQHIDAPILGPLQRDNLQQNFQALKPIKQILGLT